MYQESSLDMMNDIDSKLNRLLYRETLTKKLLAQFFVNMGFAKNISLETDKCYQEFLIDNDKYSDVFTNQKKGYTREENNKNLQYNVYSEVKPYGSCKILFKY